MCPVWEQVGIRDGRLVPGLGQAARAVRERGPQARGRLLAGLLCLGSRYGRVASQRRRRFQVGDVAGAGVDAGRIEPDVDGRRSPRRRSCHGKWLKMER